MSKPKIVIITHNAELLTQERFINYMIHYGAGAEILVVDEAHYGTVGGHIPTTDDPIYEKVFIDAPMQEKKPAVIPHKATAAKFRAIEERKKFKPKR